MLWVTKSGVIIGGSKELQELGKRKKNSLAGVPWDFPGGPVVKPSPSNARGVGSIPGQGVKIPHAS